MAWGPESISNAYAGEGGGGGGIGFHYSFNFGNIHGSSNDYFLKMQMDLKPFLHYSALLQRLS